MPADNSKRGNSDRKPIQKKSQGHSKEGALLTPSVGVPPSSKTIVTGVIGADAHVVGNWVLRYSLQKAGFKVVSLGVMVSQEEFIRAAIETHADAILVSSLYGHASLDCEGFRQKCQEAGLKDILLYIGGNLHVGGQDLKITEKTFKELGFDRVYPPETLPEPAIADLKKDLGVS